jgi:hypothetical protein
MTLFFSSQLRVLDPYHCGLSLPISCQGRTVVEKSDHCGLASTLFNLILFRSQSRLRTPHAVAVLARSPYLTVPQQNLPVSIPNNASLRARRNADFPAERV